MTPKLPESVLVVIYTDQLDVLLIERADHAGFWQSVTGSKDALEEPVMLTATREIWEETGITIDETDVRLQNWQLINQYEIYPMWRHRYAPGVIHNTEYVLGLRVPREISIILSPREHVRYQWLPYQQAAAQCFSPSNGVAILRLPEFIVNMA